MKRPTSYRTSTVFLFTTGLSVFAALIYLRASQVTGRLAQELAYDDNGYALDAIDRLGTGFQHGIFSMLATFWTNPPHTPWSSLLALMGLTVGGYNEIALYSANSILLIMATFFLALNFRKYGWGVLCLTIVCFLLSPLAYRAIFDFRPDLALGFMTATMVWWFAQGFVHGNRRAFTWAGISFGAALWIKPTFFVHTVLLALALTCLCFVAQWLMVRKRIISQWMPYREALRVLVIGLGIALPYFLLNGQRMFEYFWTNTRGDQAHIWSLSDSLTLPSLVGTFLLDRQFAFRVLGYHLFVGIAAIVIATALIYMQGRNRSLLVIAILGFSATLSLAIIISGRHNNEFFLASFQSLILLASLYSIAEASLQIHAAARRLWVALWLSLLIIAIFLNQGLVHWSIDPETKWSTRWNERIVQVIRSEIEDSPMTAGSDFLKNHQPSVFVTFAGGVNSTTLQWTSAKLGLNYKFYDLHRSDSLIDFLKEIESVDFVVLPNQALAGYYRWLPSASIQSDLADRLLMSTDWKVIPTFRPSDHYYVLASSKFINQRRPVINVPALKSVSGFLPEEGPYPQWSLPRVRWMSSKGEVCWYGDSDASYEIYTEFRSSAPGKVTLSSTKSAENIQVEADPGSFTETKFTIRSHEAAPCVSLKSHLQPVKDRAKMLLLKHFSVHQNR